MSSMNLDGSKTPHDTDFEALLDIHLKNDKVRLAEIVIDFFKRCNMPVPDWAIRVRQEARQEAAHSPHSGTAALVRHRGKRSV